MERVVLAGPLSASASFRLVVEGEWTPKECERVLDILNVVVDHLRADQDVGLPTADDVRGILKD